MCVREREIQTQLVFDTVVIRLIRLLEQLPQDIWQRGAVLLAQNNLYPVNHDQYGNRRQLGGGNLLQEQ